MLKELLEYTTSAPQVSRQYFQILQVTISSAATREALWEANSFEHQKAHKIFALSFTAVLGEQCLFSIKKHGMNFFDRKAPLSLIRN